MPNPKSTGDTLAIKAVEAVAEFEGVDAISLPPLAATITPDALNTLFDTIENPSDSETLLTLSYCGHTIRISADHTISID